MAPHDVDAPARTHVLSVEALGTGYGKKQVVFEATMHVDEGEVVGVLGHNGSGKSTTIKTILGVLPPISGKVVYRGKDCTGRNQLVSANDGQVFLNWGGGAWSLGGL